MSEPTPTRPTKSTGDLYDEYKASLLAMHKLEEELQNARTRFGNALNALNQALIEAEKK